MRPKVSYTCIACFLLLFVSGAIATANAAPPNDACSLLTKAQITAVVGVSVADGSHPAGFSKMCVWSPSSGQAQGSQSVTLNIESAASFRAAKSMLQAVANSPKNQSAQKSITMTPVSGLGDDALFSSVGSYSKLIVKKGDTVFQIVVYSGGTIEKKRDLEKALAADVLSRL
jgi:hypothetical protein